MEPKGLQGIRVPYRVIASGCGNLIRFSNLWAGLESLLRLDLSRSDQIVSKRIAYTNWAWSLHDPFFLFDDEYQLTWPAPMSICWDVSGVELAFRLSFPNCLQRSAQFACCPADGLPSGDVALFRIQDCWTAVVNREIAPVSNRNCTWTWIDGMKEVENHGAVRERNRPPSTESSLHLSSHLWHSHLGTRVKSPIPGIPRTSQNFPELPLDAFQTHSDPDPADH